MTQPKSHSQYETGHDEIDNHHKELFDLTTILDKALQTGKLVYFDHILCFLEHYVEDHFQEEESIMKAHSFDGYDRHHFEHEIFKKDVRELRAFYDQDLHHAHLVFKFRFFLDRLIFHIKTVDVLIQDIVKEN